eukprot:CAMPEP_0171241844 /NCGR_PEP_ID=MMETSP0790-20130122/45320_1 /TAXON_ID=2925 /ORGANISM="Alexandrium catenella, Strain OF101" /LENGTH=126 /DNA_ID=CAMNT_0011708497 /DNA_START=226 /DNA_END=603 /DNA_ORIENTATION=+
MAARKNGPALIWPGGGHGVRGGGERAGKGSQAGPSSAAVGAGRVGARHASGARRALAGHVAEGVRDKGKRRLLVLKVLPAALQVDHVRVLGRGVRARRAAAVHAGEAHEARGRRRRLEAPRRVDVE